MEQTNIPFSFGINRAPSQGEEGQLSECVNLIPKYGELKNVHPAEDVGIKLVDNWDRVFTLLHIHTLSTGEKHYIGGYENTSGYTLLYCFYENNTFGRVGSGEFMSKMDDIKITSIGDVMIITTSTGLHYAMWENGIYSLFDKIPDVHVNFSLLDTGTLKEDTKAVIDYKDGVYEFENTEENLNAFLGILNKSLNIVQAEKKKFALPFFVRYGIRLKNGSIINQSSPIFMEANWGTMPICIFDSAGLNEKKSWTISSVLPYFDLEYSVIDKLNESWRSIISSIVIAITPPIYSYDQSARFMESHNDVEIDSLFGYIGSTGYADKVKSCVLDNGTIVEKSLRDYLDTFAGITKYAIIPPHFSEERVKEEVLAKSNFHIIKEIDIEDIKGNFSTITNQQYVETLPLMEDDFNTHNSFIPGSTFVYNHRLSIANIKERLGFGVDVISPLYKVKNATSGSPIHVYIKENGKDYVLKQEMPEYTIIPRFGFFPHDGAYKMIWGTQELKLKKHPFLNGAYWFDNAEQPPVITEAVKPVSDNPIVDRPNYIYTSKPNNPFFFPPELQDTVGSGEIRAVTTSAKALSQGQFGEFPLYAFCSDGIWALSVTQDGKYATTNPVSRDVVDNIDTVCQVDAAVVFGTAQGLKILSGSNTQLISPAMEGENVDEAVFFKDVDDSLVVPDTNSFVSMLSEAKVLYDYTNDLLRIYPSDCETSGKHYIYSIADQQWSTYVGEHVINNVPGYPYSTIQDAKGNLLQYKPTDDTTTIRQGLILTRPIAFGSPIAMKILADLKMFYTKHGDANCKVAAFASNDQVKWYRLNSLRGHSFKWYRFRIKTNLTNLDALSGMLVLHEQRRTNKLR